MNLASRVTSIARPGSVLVTEELRRAAGDGFEWSAAQTRKLKGVEGRVALYGVTGRWPTAEDLAQRDQEEELHAQVREEPRRPDDRRVPVHGAEREDQGAERRTARADADVEEQAVLEGLVELELEALAGGEHQLGAEQGRVRAHGRLGAQE